MAKNNNTVLWIIGIGILVVVASLMGPQLGLFQITTSEPWIYTGEAHYIEGIPGVGRRSIFSDGTNWWVLDYFEGDVYKYDSNWNYVRMTYDLGGRGQHLKDIFWDGTNWWVLKAKKDGSWYNIVSKYDSNWNYLSEIKIEGPYIFAWSFFFDGTNWWLGGEVGGTIGGTLYKYDSNWNYLEEISGVGGPNKYIIDIFKDGTDWWVLTWHDKMVSKYDSNWNYLEESYYVGSEDTDPVSIFNDGTSWWVLGRVNVYRYTSGDGVCIPHASFKCHEYDVYWYDSCGNKEEKKEECGASDCVGGVCIKPDWTYTGTSWLVALNKGHYNVGDITTDGNYILGTAYQNDKVYKYSMSGSYISNWDLKYNSVARVPRGITTDGNYVWVVEVPLYGGSAEVCKYSTSGSYISCWNPSSENDHPYGITTDGNYIWVTDSYWRRTDKVYKYSMSGSYISSWSISTTNGHSGAGMMTNDGTYIWIVNEILGDEIYKYSMSGSYISNWPINSIQPNAGGIATDGNNIWIASETDTHDEVYKYSRGNGNGNGGCIPHYEKKCYSYVGWSVYWYDSCGNREEEIEDCGAHDCVDGQCIIITCQSGADGNADGKIDRYELGAFVNKWISGTVIRSKLGEAIQEWIDGC